MTAAKNYQKAKQILQSLIHGIDPGTGDELPKDAVVNQIDVNRAMLTAVMALDEMAARAARRASLPSGVGKTWSADEEESLAIEFKSGTSVEEIAKRHSRTVRAIEARLERIGLLTADQRMTHNTFENPPPKADSADE